jgi:hypothetical protein
MDYGPGGRRFPYVGLHGGSLPTTVPGKRSFFDSPMNSGFFERFESSGLSICEP